MSFTRLWRHKKKPLLKIQQDALKILCLRDLLEQVNSLLGEFEERYSGHRFMLSERENHNIDDC